MFVLAMVCPWSLCQSAISQVIAPGIPGVRAFARQIPVVDVAPDDEAAKEELNRDRAALKTDPELEALMEKAERYLGDGNYRVAATLWQAVLTRSGDALYTEDEQIYFSMVQRVENVLASLPPEGLKTYRITADAEARELLAQNGSADTTALAAVVQRYFVSSVGDDAAYKLGSIFLDRFDFSGARRLFEKIANVHPDPSVAMDQVYLKIALCDSWLGDLAAAKAMLDKSVQSAAELSIETGARSIAPRNYDLVSRSIGNLSLGSAVTEPLSVWKMPLGNGTRVGVMAAPPVGTMDGPLVSSWQFYFQPRNTQPQRRDFEGSVRAGRSAWGEPNIGTRNTVERKLIDSWNRKNWRPSGEVLFDDRRVFFRSAADVTAWDKTKIRQQIDKKLSEPPAPDPFGDSPRQDTPVKRIEQAVAWRSVWRNSFAIDSHTRLTQMVVSSFGGFGNRSRKRDSPRPTTLPEVQLFGDKIASSMSIHQDTLYVVEGPRFDSRNLTPTNRARSFRNQSVRRIRTNFLTAYDRRTGQLKWSLPEITSGDRQDAADNSEAVDVESEEYLSAGGLMAAPIGFGNLIIAPVSIGGTIYAYALDPANDGKTVWRSFLCDEAETSANGWSPIEMSINGSDLFVSCGMGVVFALDPASGVVRFARRYQRDGLPNPLSQSRGFRAPQYKYFEGWSSDINIPWENLIISFSSDRDMIEAYDRDQGELLWRCDTNPMSDGEVDYVIGIYNDILYAGGFDTVIAFQLKREGAILWGGRQLFGDQKSRGKAMLTPDGVFVPVEDSIIQYSLEGDSDGTADEVAVAKVDLGTEAPVGNLYCDGDRIWVHGANRLYALQPDPDNE